MPIFATLTKANTPIDFWTPVHEVESRAIDQLINIENALILELLGDRANEVAEDSRWQPRPGVCC